MFTRKVTGLSLASLIAAATLVAHAAPPMNPGPPANPGPPPSAPVDFCTARPNTPLTIQAAVDRGCTNITVKPGTYHENVVITADRSVTVTGTEGAASTIVDGGGNSHVFAFGWDIITPVFNRRITLTGLTIQNGSANEGGGIVHNGGGSLTLNNTVVTNNTSRGNGGGIANLQSTLTLNNSSVTNNTATYGGGISNYWYGVVNLNNSVVSGNIARRFSANGYIYGGLGGGIFNSTGTVTLTDTSVSGNTADEAGGGIANGDYPGSGAEGGTLTLNHTVVTNNTAGYGGGIYNGYFGTLTLSDDSSVTGNTPDDIIYE
jgi:hypothetical protein